MNRDKKVNVVDNKYVIRVMFVVLLGLVCIFSFNTFKRNKTETVVLESKLNTPSTWEFVIEDENIVKIYDVSSNSIEKDKKVEISYTFEGVSKGDTTIVFNYINYNTGEVLDSKTYDVSVDKNLNVKIVKSE